MADEKAILKRIGDLLGTRPDLMGKTGTAANEYAQAAISIMVQLYGTQSPQIAAFRAMIDSLQKGQRGAPAAAMMEIWRSAQGVLQNIKAEIEGGLITNLRQQIAGDVLTDFLRLAHAALEESGDGAKNVAAVLTAAAFEDAIRRLALAYVAGLTGTEDLYIRA